MNARLIKRAARMMGQAERYDQFHWRRDADIGVVEVEMPPGEFRHVIARTTLPLNEAANGLDGGGRINLAVEVGRTVRHDAVVDILRVLRGKH